MKLILISLFAAVSLLALSSCRDQVNGPTPTPAVPSDTVAYWTFDGNANDVSSNGRNATLGGTLNYIPDRFGNSGKAVEFVGNGQMNVQSMPNFTDNDSYTVSFWVNFSAGGNLISQDYGFGADTGEFSAVLGGCGQITSNESLGANKWRLITVAVSAHNYAALYIDTIQVAESAYGDYTGSNDSLPLQIAFNQLASGADTVLLDNALFLHYCLTTGQVMSRFHEGGWYEHTVPTPPQTGWVAGNFGTSASIQGLCFAWIDTAYACGFNGTILRSIDGGTTWAAQNSGTTENLYRIRFQDWNNGIAGGNNGTLLKTTNAGAVWTPLTLPSSPLVNIRDIAWSDFKSTQYPQGIMAVVGGANGGTEGVILTSIDGGVSWTVAMTTTSGALYGIDQYLWTVVGNAGQIYQYQGGTTWTSASVSNPGDDLMQVNFWGQYGITVSAEGVIYQTSNGGTSWSGPQQSPVTSSLRAVSKVSQQTEAWIAGANGVILHSTNSGASWSQQSVGGFTGAWNDIEWPLGNPHHIAFIGDNGTLYWLNQ